MLKNYLVTILRQIQKNKVFSFINIFGLALGMGACLVIAQYVNFHNSFDTFHSKGDRLFRIEAEVERNGESLGQQITLPAPLAQTLSEESPVVESIARFYDYSYANNSIVYKSGDNIITFGQNKIYIGDKEVFDLFDFDFVAGSAEKFDEPQKAILTLKESRKYFNSPKDAIGEQFTLSGNMGDHPYELVGILDDLPENSHIQFELLLSFPSMDNYTQARESWTYSSMLSYVLLTASDKTTEAVAEMDRIYEENIKENYNQSGYESDLYLKPIRDIHLSSENSADFIPGIDAKIVIALSLIAVIILVIAWINYMNLSLVRTVERLKEMGIRKCLGSSVRQITLLFIMEALVMNLIAFALAIGGTQILESYLIEVTGLPNTVLMNSSVLLLLAGLIAAGTVVIGLYPYALLKTINIVNVLIGQRGKVGGGKMRKSLVFVQFVVTFLLIAGTLTVYNQINYMRDADLGIDIENILVIAAPPGDIRAEQREDVARLNTFKTALLNYPGITAITNGGEIPGEPVGWGANLRLKNASRETSVQTGLISMDLSFPEFFGIDLVAGRELRQGDNPWGRGDAMINVKLAETLGFSDPEDAIGAEIEGFYGPVPLVVRGVVENHHHTSLHNDYSPLAYILSSWTEYYFIKLRLDDTSDKTRREQLSGLVTTVRGEWGQVFTNNQMDYFFLDRAFDEQYKEDIRFGKIFSGFASLAILIACLGLFGLTSFTVQQRTKEIGIRKVLGATFQNLVMLLSREYLLLVGTACLLSLPVGWWIMGKWLEDYSFRIDLGWWFFVVPFVVVLFLALLSIISKILGKVRANPVDSLRYE